MVLQTIRRQITVEEYHRMGDAGIFHDDERLELIDGGIVKMTPIGSRHAYVNRMTEFLITHAKAGIHEVWIVDLVSEWLKLIRNLHLLVTNR